MVIGGDLTDAKDYHPAQLTNRVVDAIAALREVVADVYVVVGNHDYLQRGHAYFHFLRHLPGVHFVTAPWDDMLASADGAPALYLPHTKSPARDWKGLDFGQFSYVFMHQTAPGSVASNGQKMDGEELPSMKGPKVYSGDIHVPQVLGGIEYIGSPYHVHFGDNFKPRCILLDKRGRAVDLHMDSPRRLSLKLDGYDRLRSTPLQRGDQVKVTLQLWESEKHEWGKLRGRVLGHLQTHGVECHGIKLEVRKSRERLLNEALNDKALTDTERMLRFVQMEELGPEALDAGLELL